MSTTTEVHPRDAIALCARLFETVLDEQSDLQLADDLRDLQQLRNLVDGEFLRRLAAFDARGGAASEHVLSTKAWLRGVLHLSPGAASGHVMVARHVRDGGPLALAAASGDVSYEHAVVVQRAIAAMPDEVRAEAEGVLTDTARFVHPSDLRVAADRVKEAVAPEVLVQDEQSARDGRYLNVARTIDGKVSVDGMLDPESGALWLAAAHAYATPLGPEDTRTGQQRRADAVTEVIAAGLTAALMPETGGEKPHVALTFDMTPLAPCRHCGRRGCDPVDQQFTTTQQHPTHDGPLVGRPPDQPERDDPPPAPRYVQIHVGHLMDGAALAGPALEQLLCDVSVHRVVTAGPSQVLDVGRSTRLWPAAIRRAAALMYQGCAADGCDRPMAFTDLHHVVHWLNGGLTSLDNAIPLCRAHHGLVHKEGWMCIKIGGLWSAVPPGFPLAQPPPFAA